MIIKSVSLFRKSLDPGSRECCHFSTGDCNPGGKPETIRKLTVHAHTILIFKNYYD